MKFVSEFFIKQKWAYLLLILAPVVLYFKGLFYPFSPMDEQWLIVNDTDFLQRWDYLPYAFKDAIQGMYYRPLLMASLIIDYHIGGLNPFTYHVTNLLFHVLASLFLYRFLRLLNTGAKTSVLLALLFTVHPVLVHAIEWVPGRNDSMLCLFSLLACIHLIKFLLDKKVIRAFLHLLFFALALATKENASLLPVIFATLFFSYSRFNKTFVVLLFTWLAGLVTWLWIRNSVIDYFPADRANFFSNLAEFVVAFITFIGKAVFPVSQSVSPTPANSSVIAGLAAIALLTFLYFKIGMRNKKIAFTGLLMFVILLIMPVWYGALSPLGEQYEHRMYTALAGLIIFAGQLNFNTQAKAFNYVLYVIIGVFAVKAFLRIDVYKTELTYLDEGIKDCPENYVFYVQKGNLLYARHDLYPALDAFNSAIHLQQQKAQLYNNRGNIYYALKKYKEAIDDYTAALKLSNTNPAILLARCKAYSKNNNPAAAMTDLQTLKACCKNMVTPQLENEINQKWMALQFTTINEQLLKDPRNAVLYVARAKLFFDLKKPRETLQDLKKACELEPDNQEYKTYYKQLSSSYPH